MKKIFVSLLCFILAAATALPAGAAEFAVMPISDFTDAPEKEFVDNDQPTPEQLEQIIKLTKPKFDVPEDYKDFTWDYFGGNIYTKPYWNLRWSKNDGGYYHVNVSCDKDGNITNFNKTSPETSSASRAFPKYSKAELIDTAKAFLEKIAPDLNLYFDKAVDAYGRYSSEYSYTFKRIENGIDYPENNATVRVNFVTGEPTHCNINYDFGIDVKSIENAITPEKAMEILGTKQKMVLSYSLLTETDEDGNVSNRAVLVYTPEHSYLSVDAISGEIYTSKSEYVGSTNGAGGNQIFGAVTEDSVESEKGDGGYRLNEEELKQLELLKGLITKDDAIKAITRNEYLLLDSSLTYADASLTKKSYYKPYGENKEDAEYIWSINFSNPAGLSEQYYYPYAYARVDAQTGEILSYECSIRDNYFYENSKDSLPEISYSEEQAESVFAEFVKQTIPEKWALTEKTNSYKTNVIQYKSVETDGEISRVPVYGAYGFNFTRVNEGIAFGYNSIYGSVDGVTGKIYHFSYNWTDDLVFDSPANAISPEKAFEIYCELSDFDLYYERYDEISDSEQKSDLYAKESTAYDINSFARPVYKSNNSGIRIGAIDGIRVNYNGAPYKEPYEDDYSDIDGHWAQRYITLLADLGVLERAEKFNPDSYVSGMELTDILSAAGLYSPEADVTEKITRLSAVKLIINALGYGKVAALEGIYKTDFSDNPEIPHSDIGFLAIASGLGIIDGDAGTNNFRPDSQITRAEAAKLVVEAVKNSY